MRPLLAVTMLSVGIGWSMAAAQTPPAPQTTPPVPQRRATPRPAAAPTAVVIVRDNSGTPLPDVKISVTGTANQSATTGADGKASLGALRDGPYRLRFEHEGSITLERDITVRNRQPAEIEVALSAAPPPPSPPEPPPPPPAPEPPPPPPSSVATAPTSPPVFIAIPAFLDKNYIGREPLKESVLGCLADSTTRVLQLHDNVAEHTHRDLDEIIYVVAGEGAIRVRDQSSAIAAGTLAIVPHGQAHAIERRGKNPLMLLSMLSGTPCRQQGTSPAASDTVGARK
jgi:mannose-6-phosphate isomerase-like protein (cupin superfamily)